MESSSTHLSTPTQRRRSCCTRRNDEPFDQRTMITIQRHSARDNEIEDSFRAAMAARCVVPVGLLQAWAAVEKGYWYARSSEFLHTLRWMCGRGAALDARSTSRNQPRRSAPGTRSGSTVWSSCLLYTSPSPRDGLL